MTEINFDAHDLNTPGGRQSLFEEMPPDRETVTRYHAELLDLFDREMKFRRETDEKVDGGPPSEGGETDYFEQLYWCGLLLYLAGDPADVPLMWKAKHINMDTRAGFDGQFMVGAGVDATLTYLKDNRYIEIADYLQGLRKSKDLDDLAEWERFRINYFYPDSRKPLPGK
jgi:hypothetical protein